MSNFQDLISDRYGDNQKANTSHSESNQIAYRELKQPQSAEKPEDYYDGSLSRQPGEFERDGKHHRGSI